LSSRREAASGGGGGGHNWTSLLSSGVTIIENRGGVGIGRGRLRGLGGLGGDQGEGGGAAAPTVNTPTKAAEGQHTRTDFIILLMWQEPTPSDELRKLGGRK
jgi:hypothetical protein